MTAFRFLFNTTQQNEIYIIYICSEQGGTDPRLQFTQMSYKLRETKTERGEICEDRLQSKNWREKVLDSKNNIL